MLNALAMEPRAESHREPELAPEELGPDCVARARIYRLLGGVFAEEPAAEFLSALRAPESLHALAEAGLTFGPDFTASALATLVDDLSSEYTMMFVASGGFPPVESVRVTGRYYQAPHFAVKQAYRQAGYEVCQGRFHVFDDQLGIELMFVGELLERAALALGRGDTIAYRRIERDVKRFWALHLGRWVRGYAALVQRATEHSFYREMAKLLAAFADDEIARMSLRVDDVDGGREVVPKSEVAVLFNPDEPECNACGGAQAPLRGESG